MDDPNVTKDARAAMRRLRAAKALVEEKELGVHRAVLNDLVRRGWIRDLGGGRYLLTEEGRRVVARDLTGQ
jgi:predicted transcriptional regulator